MKKNYKILEGLWQLDCFSQRTLIIIFLFITLNGYSQSFEKINCLGLTTTEVKSKMAKIEIACDWPKVYKDSISMGFRSNDYGLIICLFNKNNICYLQRIRANNSMEHLQKIDWPVKIIEKLHDQFIITYKPNSLNKPGVKL